MSRQLDNLYRVQKKDFPKAGAVLADAFEHDPVWEKVLEETGKDFRRTFFQGPVRYCSTYGKAYASSEHLEGIAAWVPGNLADMTVWRMIRCGSLTSGIGMAKGMIRVGQRMSSILGPLEVDRKANMNGRVYLYLMIIGVASRFQGRGFGGMALRALIEESEQLALPVYLETATERNVGMYERLGFTLLSKTSLPVIHLPQWEMVREPGAS